MSTQNTPHPPLQPVNPQQFMAALQHAYAAGHAQSNLPLQAGWQQYLALLTAAA
jgi:hypothetical protein